jgi:hypothetical protein
MIKARATTPLGLDLAILGLSAENVMRLTEGKPIKVNLSELGLPAIEVVIAYGDTEDSIRGEFLAAGVQLREYRDER